MAFREYKDEDKNLLLKFINKLEEYVKPLDPIKRVLNLPGYSELALKETLEDIEKNNRKIWFALDGSKVVGFIAGVVRNQTEINRLEIGPHKVGEVADLYLDEEYRNKGIGTEMLKIAEEYFKSMECDGIWLSVFYPNENAHNFYKKLGFTDREVGMLKQL